MFELIQWKQTAVGLFVIAWHRHCVTEDEREREREGARAIGKEKKSDEKQMWKSFSLRTDATETYKMERRTTYKNETKVIRRQAQIHLFLFCFLGPVVSMTPHILHTHDTIRHMQWLISNKMLRLFAAESKENNSTNEQTRNTDRISVCIHCILHMYVCVCVCIRKWMARNDSGDVVWNNV